MRFITAGATSQSVYFEVLDSTSTNGGRLSTLVFNTSGLTAYYSRNGAASVAITLVTQTAAGAWSSGGFVAVDTTNMPGLYRLDVPNAAFAAGVPSVAITLRGATGMAQVSSDIQLTVPDLQAALATPTNITAGTITTTTNLTNLPSIPANWLTATGISASALNGKGDWLLSSGYTSPPSSATVAGAVWDVTLSGHLTAGTTGNALNASGSAGDPWTTAVPGAYGAGTAGNILGNNLNATVSSRLPTASYTAPDNADILLIKAKTDNLPASPAAVGSAMTLTSGERTSVADSLLDRDMSVGADSGSPTVRTVRQALRFLRNKFALSGTALTVYKEDDLTSSWTSVVGTDAAANPVISSDPA